MKAVGSLQDRHLARQPKGSPQSGIAVFRDLAQASEHPGLIRCQINSTKIKKLAEMAKAARIAHLRQDREGVDWANAGDRG